MPKYADACMFILSVLSHYNFTFAMPIHVFFFLLYFTPIFLTFGVARQLLAYIGSRLKKVEKHRLTGTIYCAFYWLQRYTVDTKGIRMSVASSARSRYVTTNKFCCNKPVWFVDLPESHDTIIQRNLSSTIKPAGLGIAP
jgi:hypothetical protein